MELIELILASLAGALALYLTAYTKTKGKNKALKEDLARLETEKQSVIAKYQAETEELKKTHALDIEKRKHQYSAKKEQFVHFFSKLDSYNDSARETTEQKFPVIFNEFMKAYVSGTEEDQARANEKFSIDMNELFTDLYRELVRVRNETNTIRMIASADMDALLDNLDSDVERATEDAKNTLGIMATSEFWADQTIIKPLQKKSEDSANALLQTKSSLISQMKKELEEI
ncbi:MAG: hypothetical protein ACRBBW_20895 [Cellvibrionaceae bacterium]